MARLMKFLALAVSIIILLLIVAAVALTTLVSPNRFKPQLSQYVKTKTARELKINGDISWTFFPHFGLKISDAQLGNPTGFVNQPFAEIAEADVQLAPIPLLKKQIVAKKLSLNSVQLNLIKNKAGKVNWQFTETNAVDKSQQTLSLEQGAAAPLVMNIAKVNIENSGINYWDQQADKQYEVKHLNFTGENIAFKQTFPVHLRFQAFSNKSNSKAELDLKAKLNIQPDLQSVQVTDLNIDVNLNGDNLPNKKLQLNIKAAIEKNLEQLVIKPITIVLDKTTTISGELSKNLVNELLSFNFKIPELNFAPSQASSTQEASQSSASAALLPLALLKDLKANGTLEIGKLVANKLTLNNLSANLNANNGIIQLAPLQAKLYQGSYQAQLSIDARSNIPSIATQQELKNVQIGELLIALGKQGKFPLSGTGDVSLQLTTLGNDKTTWLKNLAGNAKFAITKGVIENIDLEYQLQRINSFINKAQQPATPATQQTSFTSLAGSLQISNGVADNSDLSLQSSTLQVKGQGSIDLNQQNLNYRLQARAISQNLGQDVFKIQDFLGGSLPIMVTGSWLDPKVEPDWKIISQAIAKSLLSEKGGQLKDKLDEQLTKHLGSEQGARLKQALGNLLH